MKQIFEKISLIFQDYLIEIIAHAQIYMMVLEERIEDYINNLYYYKRIILIKFKKNIKIIKNLIISNKFYKKNK